MKGHILEECILLGVAVACFCPTANLFVDGSLLPKWYLFFISSSVLAIYRLSRAASRKQDGLKWHRYLFIVAVFTSIVSLGDLLRDCSKPLCWPFDSPAGLALSLNCALAVTLKSPQPTTIWRKVLYAMGLISISSTIICTQSRIGIISLGLIMFRWLILTDKAVAAKVVTLMIAGVFLMLNAHKNDSTLGRIAICRITVGMILERPVLGWGLNGFRRFYMPRQADFLDEHPDVKAMWLSDDIRHPLNEFLLWWVNGGIMGLLLITLLLFFPLVYALFRCHISLHTDNLALLIVVMFSLVSYPLHYPIAWLVVFNSWSGLPVVIKAMHRMHTICCLACTLCISLTLAHGYFAFQQRRAELAAVRHHHRTALKLFESMYPWCAWNPHFLYSYMVECYTIGKFDVALHLNDLCYIQWNNYDLALLRADILFQMQDYNEAISYYKLSSRMCPVRFAPLAGLMESYDAVGDTLQLQSIATAVLEKPVKIPSEEIDRIKARAYRYKVAELATANTPCTSGTGASYDFNSAYPYHRQDRR